MVLVTSSHGVKLNNKKTGVPHIVGIWGERQTK